MQSVLFCAKKLTRLFVLFKRCSPLWLQAKYFLLSYQPIRAYSSLCFRMVSVFQIRSLPRLVLGKESALITRNETKKTRGSSLFLKIEGRESNIAKLDPIKISRALYHEVGPVKEFKKSGNKVVVSCNDTKQALELRALTELRSLNMLISVSEDQTEPDFCQGIIRNVDLELTVEALADEFKNQNAFKVRRLGKTRTVLLYFKGTSLPYDKRGRDVLNIIDSHNLVVLNNGCGTRLNNDGTKGSIDLTLVSPTLAPNSSWSVLPLFW